MWAEQRRSSELSAQKRGKLRSDRSNERPPVKPERASFYSKSPVRGERANARCTGMHEDWLAAQGLFGGRVVLSQAKGQARQRCSSHKIGKEKDDLPVVFFNFGVFARVGDLSGLGFNVSKKPVDLDARDQHRARIEPQLLHLDHFAVLVTMRQS